MNDGPLPDGKGASLDAGDGRIFKFECKRIAEQKNNIVTAMDRFLKIRGFSGKKSTKDKENCDALFRDISIKIDAATKYNSEIFDFDVSILLNEVQVLIHLASVFLGVLKNENKKIDEESISLLSESISMLNKSREKLSGIRPQKRPEVLWKDTLPRR